jgi:hypothetical protein
MSKGTGVPPKPAKGRYCSSVELERIKQRDVAQTARIAVLEVQVEAARRFAEAVPFFHMLTDYVEYEIAYQELCDLLGIREGSDV